MATRRAEIIYSAQDRASVVMRQLGLSADKLQSNFEKINVPFLRFQTLAASIFSGAVIGGFRQLVGAIDDLDEAAQGLGTTAVQLASIRRAATEAGVGAEKLDTAFTRLNVRSSEAARGNKEAAALFEALGVSITTASGDVRDSAEILGDVADKFAGMQDGPAKAALAVELFGKAGAALIPLLNGGSEALRTFTGLTAETVKEANRAQREVDALASSWERLKFTLAGTVLPVLNDVIDVVRRLDFGKIREEFNSFPLGNFGAAFVEYGRQVDAAAQKVRQLRDALKLSEGTYSNEGRAALQSAQAVLNDADARTKAAAAAEKQAAALKKLKQEQLDAASAAALAQLRREDEATFAAERIEQLRLEGDAMRKLAALRRQDAAEQEAEQEFERKRLEIMQLTGQADEERKRRLAEQLELMIQLGQVTQDQALVAVKAIGGMSDEVERGEDAFRQLGLTITSSLGELISSGGKGRDVMKALGQDVLKLITQMLILKPLAEELKKIFDEWGKGKGGGGSLLGDIIGALGGLFGGGSAPSGGSWGVVDTGALAVRPGGTFAAPAAASIVVNVASGVDRAGVAVAVERGVRAGLARSYDSTRRGGAGVFA